MTCTEERNREITRKLDSLLDDLNYMTETVKEIQKLRVKK